MRKTNLASLLARRPHRIFLSGFEQSEIGPDLFRTPAARDSKAWFRSAATPPLGSAGQSFGGEPEASSYEAGDGFFPTAERCRLFPHRGLFSWKRDDEALVDTCARATTPVGTTCGADHSRLPRYSRKPRNPLGQARLSPKRIRPSSTATRT